MLDRAVRIKGSFPRLLILSMRPFGFFTAAVILGDGETNGIVRQLLEDLVDRNQCKSLFPKKDEADERADGPNVCERPAAVHGPRLPGLQLKKLRSAQGQCPTCENGKKTVEGKSSEPDAINVHHPQGSHDRNRVYEEKSGSLKQFPEMIYRDGKAYGVPVHKNLNSVTKQESEKNDGE